jgi:prevent-host-death family protein
VNSWSVQDAKARFSELLETCLNEGPQLVTRRGTDAAVLVPVRDWQELQRMARPALKDCCWPTARAQTSSFQSEAEGAGANPASLPDADVSLGHQCCVGAAPIVLKKSFLADN